MLEVGLSVKGWWEDSQEQMERPLPAAGANLREESSWLDVHADQEYVLQVSLRRINLGQQRVSTVLTVMSSHMDVAFESRRMNAHLHDFMSKNGKDSEWLYSLVSEAIALSLCFHNSE